MRKILAIAWKELYTFFRDRNLLLLSFATPLVLSTIIGMAFGGLGDSDAPDFADIPLAVVNLDEGVDLQEAINLQEQILNLDALPFDLNNWALSFGDSGIGLGSLPDDGSTLNFGDQLAGILLSRPAASVMLEGAGIDVAEIGCSLLDESEDAGAVSFAAGSSLDDLLDATSVSDANLARAAVDSGEYVAAVIIPPGFSSRMIPSFVFDEDGRLRTQTLAEAGSVEVYANNGRPISARIVHSIVEGVVNQFVRINVAFSATLETSANTLLDSFDRGDFDLSAVDISAPVAALQDLDTAVIEPLGCLIVPGASNITIAQQPLDALQEAPPFARMIVPIGASQAVFLRTLYRCFRHPFHLRRAPAVDAATADCFTHAPHLPAGGQAAWEHRDRLPADSDSVGRPDYCRLRSCRRADAYMGEQYRRNPRGDSSAVVVRFGLGRVCRRAGQNTGAGCTLWTCDKHQPGRSWWFLRLRVA